MKTLIKMAAVFMALLNIGYCMPAPVHADSEASSEAGMEAGITGRRGRRGYWRQQQRMQQQSANQQNRMAMMAQRRNGGGGGGGGVGGGGGGRRAGLNHAKIQNWNGGPRKRPTNSAVGNITTAPSTATSPVGSAGTSSATTSSGAPPSIPSAVTNP